MRDTFGIDFIVYPHCGVGIRDNPSKYFNDLDDVVDAYYPSSTFRTWNNPRLRHRFIRSFGRPPLERSRDTIRRGHIVGASVGCAGQCVSIDGCGDIS